LYKLSLLIKLNIWEGVNMKKYAIQSNFILAIAILIGLIIACGQSKQIKSNKQTTKSVTYKVTSNGSNRPVDITLESGQGTTAQYNNKLTPFETTITFSSGDFVYLSAQNQTDRGSITVSISVNGVKFKETTCEGEYCIASVSGSVE
jgi:hypothetical protein